MLLPFVSTRFQILFHSLAQGSFHLSLTVLFTIGQQQYLALRDLVHADSRQIPRARRYSGASSLHIRFMFYRTFTFFGPASQLVPLTHMQIKHYDNPLMEVPQPRASNAVRLALARFRLFPVRSPLLRESFLLSFPPAT